jgi:predicted DsbA family dithiol-disulfide isomerase
VTTSTRPTISIDIFSDVVCPWCYIGKRRFETGLSQIHDDLGVDFDVTYHAYQLDPTAPPGVATPVREAYAKKFGGPERAEEILAHVTTTAAEDGITFNMDRALRANTLLAHRLIWLAGQPDSPIAQAAMKERLMQAYFTDGDHIGTPEVLAACAAELGFDRDAVESFLASSQGLAEVQAELDDAQDNGITAVPTYVFNREWAVPGAQDADTFEKVLRKMAANALAAAEPA